MAPKPACSALSGVRLVPVQPAVGTDDSSPFKSFVASSAANRPANPVNVVKVCIVGFAGSMHRDGSEHRRRVRTEGRGDLVYELADPGGDKANLIKCKLAVPATHDVVRLVLTDPAEVCLASLPQRPLIPQAVLPQNEIWALAILSPEISVDGWLEIFLPALFKCHGAHVIHPPPIWTIRPTAAEVPLHDSEVELGDIAHGICARAHAFGSETSIELLAEELCEIAIDRVANEKHATAPEPRHEIILVLNVIARLLLRTLFDWVDEGTAASGFGDGVLHPWYWDGGGFEIVRRWC